MKELLLYLESIPCTWVVKLAIITSTSSKSCLLTVISVEGVGEATTRVVSAKSATEANPKTESFMMKVRESEEGLMRVCKKGGLRGTLDFAAGLNC